MTMTRLTKKFNGEYYRKDATTIIFNSEVDYNAIQKLGKLEDLMKKYNIDSVEELDNVLSTKYVIGGMRSNGKTLINKGILYNKISEQIGCPLEVLFKALFKNEGIKTIKNNIYYVNKIVRMSNGYLAFELELAQYFYLKDYQKTWWLKGEKNDT